MSQQSAISQMQELQIEKEKVDGVNWFKKSLDFSFFCRLNISPDVIRHNLYTNFAYPARLDFFHFPILISSLLLVTF